MMEESFVNDNGIAELAVKDGRMSRREEFLRVKNDVSCTETGKCPGSRDKPVIPSSPPQNASNTPQANASNTLQACSDDLYELCMPIPEKEITVKTIKEIFLPFGPVAKITLDQHHAYVSYTTKGSADSALETLRDKYNVDLAPHKTKPKENGFDTEESGPARGQDIYMSNLSKEFTQEQFEMLMQPFKPLRVKLHDKQGEMFSYGFVQFGTFSEAKLATTSLNGKQYYGKKLIVRIVRDKSRVRILERAPAVSTPQNPMSVHISYIPLTVAEEDIEQLFVKYGGAVKVQMGLTRNGQRQWACVHLRSESFVRQAISGLDGTNLHRAYIRVSLDWNPVGLSAAKGQSAHCHGHAGGGVHRGHGSPVHQARELTLKIGVLSSEVLDNCEICKRITGLISELKLVLDDMDG